MRKSVVFSVLFVLFLSFVSANPHYGVNYKIYGDKTLVEINFGEVSDFEFIFPKDAKTIEVNSEGYELIDGNTEKILKISYSPNLQVSYVSERFIEKTSDRYLFIVVNDFEYPLSVMLSLPEGGFLAQGNKGIVIPGGYSVTTDGRIISLIWNNFIEEEIVVAYEKPTDFEGYFYFFIFLLTLFLIYFAYSSIWFKEKMRKILRKPEKKTKPSKKVQVAKVKKEVTRNLFGEEKQIIEYLIEKKGKESWTKEIVHDLGISKVRLSRRLRNLVQRGLIEKIPYGNENRIRLLNKG